MGKIKYFTFILLILIGNTVVAQVTPPPPPLPVPLPGLPIDSILFVLLVTGLALGSIFVLRKHKKSNS